MKGIVYSYFYPELCERLFESVRAETGRMHVLNASHLGNGAFGTSYRVRGWFQGNGLSCFPQGDDDGDARSQNDCCLKVMPKQSWDSSYEEYAERCYAEYELLRKANGAYGRVPRPLAFGTVIGSTDTGEEVTAWAICMEFLPTGADIHFLSSNQIIQDRNGFGVRRPQTPANKRCSPLQAATLAYQTCLALIDLHNMGVTHRDLQQSNIAARFSPKRNSDGSKIGIVDRVYLIDLGNSTLKENEVTPVYGMVHLAQRDFGAPEIFAIDDEVGPDGRTVRCEMDHYALRNLPSADVWSFGAIIGYYLTGKTLREVAPNLSYYEKYCVPKKKGFDVLGSLSDDDRKAFEGDKVLMALHEIVSDCTKYDPRDRADLQDVRLRLEHVLGIDNQDPMRTILHQDVLSLRPTQSVSIGPWEMRVDATYRRIEGTGLFIEYERHVHETLLHLIMSCETGVSISGRKAYVAELVHRMGGIYGSGGVPADLDERAHDLEAGGIQKELHTFELVERDGTPRPFLSKHCLCFVEDSVIRVGMGCEFSEGSLKDLQDTMDRELAIIVSSLGKA